MGIMQPVDCSKYDQNTSILSCIIFYRNFTSDVFVFSSCMQFSNTSVIYNVE